MLFRSNEQRLARTSMALASKQPREPIGARTSLLRPVGANCAPALLSSVRVAHVTTDPPKSNNGTSFTACTTDPPSDLFTGLYAQLRQIAQSALRRSGPA